MSLATFKRKSQVTANPISGKGRDGFSLVGGYRNIGVVGQTNLGRSVTRTPFRGNAPMGHGGCCGKYVVNVCNSGSCCTNDPAIIKTTVKNTAGMLDDKYKWTNGTYPNWWVQNTSAENSSQGVYINKQKRKAATCVVTSTDAGLPGCRENVQCNTWIGGIPHLAKYLAKDPKAAVSSGEYMTAGLMKNNCLPSPASKQPFPMNLVHNGCDVNFNTWQEAQAAGLLPANYVG